MSRDLLASFARDERGGGVEHCGLQDSVRPDWPWARGKCSKSGESIEEGEIRIGSMVLETGTYGRWVKLTHWRVPSSIWKGIDGIEDEDEVDKVVLVKKALNDMDGLVLCGFTDLDEKGKQAVAERVCNPGMYGSLEPVPSAQNCTNLATPHTALYISTHMYIHENTQYTTHNTLTRLQVAKFCNRLVLAWMDGRGVPTPGPARSKKHQALGSSRPLRPARLTGKTRHEDIFSDQ